MLGNLIEVDVCVRELISSVEGLEFVAEARDVSAIPHAEMIVLTRSLVFTLPHQVDKLYQMLDAGISEWLGKAQSS